MPPNDPPRTFAALWSSLAARGDAVLVGAAKLAAGLGHVVGGASELPPGREYTVMCWGLADPPDLAALRRALGPGGVLAVVVAPPLGGLRRLLPWGTPDVSGAVAATALVVAGFTEPRTQHGQDGSVVVWGQLPAVPHALDTFFHNPR